MTVRRKKKITKRPEPKSCEVLKREVEQLRMLAGLINGKKEQMLMDSLGVPLTIEGLYLARVFSSLERWTPRVLNRIELDAICRDVFKTLRTVVVNDVDKLFADTLNDLVTLKALIQHSPDRFSVRADSRCGLAFVAPTPLIEIHKDQP